MAERRMFAKTIIDSDAFLDMPLSTQALYFHLSMRADDEGFVNNPKKISRMIGTNDDDLKLLIAKRFLLAFDSGVVVIKHWRIHNYLQNDRVKDTVYQEERQMLEVGSNRAYTMKKTPVSNLYTNCIQTVSKADTQNSIDQISIVESRSEEDRSEEGSVEEEESGSAATTTSASTDPVKILLNNEAQHVVTADRISQMQKLFPQINVRAEMEAISRKCACVASQRRSPEKIDAYIFAWMKLAASDAAKEAGRTSSYGKNSFHNFKQHDYDFNLIDRMLDYNLAPAT
jgi:hypothetical protein